MYKGNMADVLNRVAWKVSEFYGYDITKSLAFVKESSVEEIFNTCKTAGHDSLEEWAEFVYDEVIVQ